MIGLEPSSICEEIQIIDGIVIEPSVACYNEEEEMSRDRTENQEKTTSATSQPDVKPEVKMEN